MKSNITKRFPTVVVASFTLGTMILTTAWADQKEDEILARVAQFHAAATAANLTAIADIVAEDTDATAIGTDPTEIFQGHTDIVGWWESLFTLLGGGLKTQIMETIQVDYRDVVAWVAQLGEWDLSALGVPDPVPFRVTLVLEKQMGNWDIVQQHFSLAIPNPE